MSQEHKIKEFWEEQAIKFKDSPTATAPDVYYRELEIDSVSSFLRNKTNVLDVGCGNGYSTFKFAKKFPKMTIVGVDYSPTMIECAKNTLMQKNNKLKSRVSFVVGDARSLAVSLSLMKKFDFVVSERCLINLLSWKEQQIAVLQMKKVLKSNGKIILCENTIEGLHRLNDIRQKLDLPAISMRWHNSYMPEDKLTAFAKKHFVLVDVKNIGSLYYIISRVVYAKLCQIENKNPDYLHSINRIAAKLPHLGDFSPNHIFVLRKR